jgi:hypothetical protein
VYPPFKPCIADPGPVGCNATQFAQWSNFSSQFLGALAAARAATPPGAAAGHGGFITSCPIHTTAIGGLSHRITIGGVTMYDAVVEWVFQTRGAGADYWTYDVDWPGDKSCPPPAPPAGEVGEGVWADPAVVAAARL